MLFECGRCCLVNDPALEEDIDDEDGKQSQDGCGEDESLVGDVRRLEPDDQERNGSFFWRGEDDERPEIIVPGGHESEDTEGRERRSHLREDDLAVNAKLGCAVDAGGVHKFGGHGFDELLHHEDAIRVNEGRDDERPERVDQAEFDDQQIVWDHDHLKWNHDLDQNDSEGEVLAFEMIFGKDVARIRTGEERDDHAHQRNEDAVPEVLRDGNSFIGEDGSVMFECRLGREEIWRSLAQLGGGFQRGNHNVEERQQRADQSKNKDGVRAGFTEDESDGWFFGRVRCHFNTPTRFSRF